MFFYRAVSFHRIYFGFSPFWANIFITCFKLNSHEWWPLHCVLVVDFIYYYFYNCCFRGSKLYIFFCLWDHVVDILFLCTDFICFIPKSDCSFLFGLFIYLFHPSSFQCENIIWRKASSRNIVYHNEIKSIHESF